MRKITTVLISTLLLMGVTNLTFNKHMEEGKLETANNEYEKENHNEVSSLLKQKEKLIEAINLNEEKLKQKQQPRTISESKAISLVKDMFSNSGYVPSVIEVDHREGNKYVVHAYEIIQDDEETWHTATAGWYYVDMYTGKIESIF